MPRHRYSCPLRWGDLDAQGHVNNAAYLDYLQEARVHFLLTRPPVLQRLLSTGVLVVHHQVEYLSPLDFSPDGVAIELWVTAVGASRFEIGYDLLAGEALVARARTGAVPYDLATATLRRLTTEERALLTEALETTEPLRPVATVRWSGREHRFALTMRWGDLDSYGHANNVKFFDYVQEARLALMSEAFGWPVGDAGDDPGVWMVVRQDLEYLRPLDFRLAPYQVGTVVAEIGRRSFTLAVDIRDPDTGTRFATARTVVVAPTPLSPEQRGRLDRWRTGGEFRTAGDKSPSS